MRWFSISDEHFDHPYQTIAPCDLIQIFLYIQLYNIESYTIILVERNLNKDRNMEYQCCFNSHIEI